MKTQLPLRLWVAGQGGQGVSFMARLLCKALCAEHKFAISRGDPEWGIRGGQVVASVLMNTRPINLSEALDYNVVIYLHPAVRTLRPFCSPDVLEIDVYALGFLKQARALGFEQGLNLMALGALLSHTPWCHPNSVVWQLKRQLGRDAIAALPKNLTLFEQGLAQKFETTQPESEADSP